MNLRNYLLISGTLFTLVATIQLGRAIVDFPVLVNGWLVPRMASVVLGTAAAAMALWALRLFRGTR